MDIDSLQKIFADTCSIRKAKQGFIIDGADGSFHVQDVFFAHETEGLEQDELFYLAFCSKKEIIRLRGIKNSYDYLLKLRVDAIVDAPRSTRVMRARRKIYEERGHIWHLSHYYHVLDNYHKGYAKKISKKNMKKIKQIPSGLMLINDTNALCMKSLVGDLVVASENMIHFCYFMTIGFFGTSYGFNDLDCDVAKVIAMRIMLGNESLDFDLDPRCVLDKKIESKIMNSVELQMQFIFGHEYAHILLGHLDYESTNWIACQSFAIEGDIKVANYSHCFEYDADCNAILNVVSIENRKEILKAALIFFIFLDIYSQFCVSVSKSQYCSNNTHPKSCDRFLSLVEKFNKLLDSDEIMCLYEETRNIGKYIHEIFKAISIQENKDVINFYGSIYLSSYKPYKLKDRIDY